MFYICSVFDAASPAPDLAPPDPSPDLGEDRTQRHLRTLERFAEINLAAAEALGERIVRRAAEEDPETPAERAAADAALGALSLGLERVGRSLRRALAMEALVAEQGLGRRLLAQAERAQKAAARRERVLERRNAVQVAMTDAIDRPARPETEVDRLLDDLNDWMDVQDDDAFAGEGPLGALLWTACQAVELPVDLTVWEHEDWAAEEIVQRPPGSPFRAHRVTRGGPGLTWSDPPSPSWGGTDREAIRVGNPDSDGTLHPTPWASTSFPTPDLRSDPPHKGEGGVEPDG